MNALGAIPVVSITYGHHPDMVADALGPFISASDQGARFRPIVLDDCSGQEPHVDGVETFVTPSNGGYCAAVNFAVEKFGKLGGRATDSRIVFVNPDVVIAPADVAQVAAKNSPFPLVVPTIEDSGLYENVRRTLSAAQVLTHIISPRLARQGQHQLQREGGHLVVHTPLWTAAGTVASFSVDWLQRYPLDPQLFWIEMSGWARAVPSGTPILVTGAVIEHIGASSEETSPVKVRASRLAARIAYVRIFGGLSARSALPVAFALGRALDIVRGRTTLRGFRQLVAVYGGRRSWQSLSKP